MLCNKKNCDYYGKQSCKLKIIKWHNKQIVLGCDINQDVSITMPIDISNIITNSLQSLEVARLILKKEFHYDNFLPCDQIQLAVQLMKEMK